MSIAADHITGRLIVEIPVLSAHIPKPYYALMRDALNATGRAIVYSVVSLSHVCLANYY
jgi:hypothetical protein